MDREKSGTSESHEETTDFVVAECLSDEMSMIAPELTVRRPVYQQDELHRLCKYTEPKKTVAQEFSKGCQRIEPFSLIRKSVPVIGWLPEYDWKNNILGDVTAGITVAVMHIPQGMAYAILGNVPPIVGIYMAFFPVLVYFFLGTSRHNSMGTFALICMMTGKVVATYSNNGTDRNNVTATMIDDQTKTDPLIIPATDHYSPVEVATVVTFTVAVIQLGMYVLRLGVICSLLADSLISGFTTAAAMHVFTSQIKDLLGLNDLPGRKGPFKLILTYVDVFNYYGSINLTAVLLSAITIIVLLINNEILKAKVAKICPFPVPIEMLAVAIGTIVSVKMNLSGNYDIVTVGDIPVGLPVPSVPPISLIPNVLVDSIVITMVSYTISMSMALIFAQKVGYEVDSNQELVAQSLGNLVGSFFSCMPFTASLSRSLIQQTVGGHTQLASLISCGILISVLLWIGPFFEPLPRCVLASIIVVALKGMLLKVTEFLKFWRLDKLDAAIWMITFLTVILLDVEYGLLVGMILCLGKLIILSVHPYTCKLALAPGTEIYLDAKRYQGTVEIPGIKIFHFSGSLNFASRQHFRDEVYKVAELIPRKVSSQSGKGIEEITKLRILILDFTALTYIDIAGATTLQNLIKEYCSIQVFVYIAGCSGPVYDMMRKCNLIDCKHDRFFGLFPTVSDAVHYARYSNDVLATPTWNLRLYEENCISRL